MRCVLRSRSAPRGARRARAATCLRSTCSSNAIATSFFAGRAPRGQGPRGRGRGPGHVPARVPPARPLPRRGTLPVLAAPDRPPRRGHPCDPRPAAPPSPARRAGEPGAGSAERAARPTSSSPASAARGSTRSSRASAARIAPCSPARHRGPPHRGDRPGHRVTDRQRKGRLHRAREEFIDALRNNTDDWDLPRRQPQLPRRLTPAEQRARDLLAPPGAKARRRPAAGLVPSVWCNTLGWQRPLRRARRGAEPPPAASCILGLLVGGGAPHEPARTRPRRLPPRRRPPALCGRARSCSSSACSWPRSPCAWACGGRCRRAGSTTSGRVLGCPCSASAARRARCSAPAGPPAATASAVRLGLAIVVVFAALSLLGPPVPVGLAERPGSSTCRALLAAVVLLIACPRARAARRRPGRPRRGADGPPRAARLLPRPSCSGVRRHRACAARRAVRRAPAPRRAADRGGCATLALASGWAPAR